MLQKLLACQRMNTKRGLVISPSLSLLFFFLQKFKMGRPAAAASGVFELERRKVAM